MTWQCGVCQHWVHLFETHNCSETHAGPPVLVLEPHEIRKDRAA